MNKQHLSPVERPVEKKCYRRLFALDDRYGQDKALVTRFISTRQS